jgi:transcriptional accessory protein Tex/SPT6
MCCTTIAIQWTDKVGLGKEEKERGVIDLYYNQRNTFRDIAKELRMWPNVITAILKKKNKGIIVVPLLIAQQQSSSSFATKAYELFLKGNSTHARI